MHGWPKWDFRPFLALPAAPTLKLPTFGGRGVGDAVTVDEELRQVRAEIQQLIETCNSAGDFFWPMSTRRRYDELCRRERALLQDS